MVDAHPTAACQKAETTSPLLSKGFRDYLFQAGYFFPYSQRVFFSLFPPVFGLAFS